MAAQQPDHLSGGRPSDMRAQGDMERHQPLALKEGDDVLVSSEDLTPAGLASLTERGGKAPRMSRRESEVLRLLVTGLSMKQIAVRLGISPRTVSFHKYKVMKANELDSNAALFGFVRAQGMLGESRSGQTTTAAETRLIGEGGVSATPIGEFMEYVVGESSNTGPGNLYKGTAPGEWQIGHETTDVRRAEAGAENEAKKMLDRVNEEIGQLEARADRLLVLLTRS